MEIFNTYYTEEYFWSSSSSAEDNGISSSSSKSAFFGRRSDFGLEQPEKAGGSEKVPGDEAPGLPRREAAELRQVGVRSEGAEEEVENMAGDFPRGGGRRGRCRGVAENDDVFYMDEEAVFGMHGLLANMAEGLMLPPPQYSDDVEVDADVSLWSFSI
ncbi:hypothetical protein DH2020_040312 [Rehmannia glutinosa]|uniref:Uncharacterized protein n=1 Tax=Rehmannia glutinosa TaxID=99300 RepID=A0ABR0UU05_REHGL